MMRWRTALTTPHGAGGSLQTWLWAPPVRHSSRQIEEMIERIESFYELRVHERMANFPDDLLRRHARRLAGRPPSAGALIQEPARSVETACFLRYCLLLATDRLLMMVRRQVADLWRRAASGALATTVTGPFCIRIYSPSLAGFSRTRRMVRSGGICIRSSQSIERADRPAVPSSFARPSYRWRTSGALIAERTGTAALGSDGQSSGARRLAKPPRPQRARAAPTTRWDADLSWPRLAGGPHRRRPRTGVLRLRSRDSTRPATCPSQWDRLDRPQPCVSQPGAAVHPARPLGCAAPPLFPPLGLPTDPAVFLEPLVARAEVGMAAVAAAAKAGTLLDHARPRASINP